MMSRTFGAPFGGTTRAGQYGFDCAALVVILPPNFWGGGGSWSPVIDIVELGEPGVPYICCAVAGATGDCTAATTNTSMTASLFIVTSSKGLSPSLPPERPPESNGG